MEAIEVMLERHDQKIKSLEKELSAMREIQTEIKVMNEALVTLGDVLNCQFALTSIVTLQCQRVKLCFSA